MSMSQSLECVNVTLFGKRVFADVIKLRIWRWRDQSPWIVCSAINPMKSIFMWQTEEKTEKRRQCDNEAKIGVIQPQVKEYWPALPDAGGNKNQILP